MKGSKPAFYFRLFSIIRFLESIQLGRSLKTDTQNHKERLIMNIRKRIILKLAIVISLLAINVIAATPGSRCTVRARLLGLISVTLVGRVNAQQYCYPLPPIPDLLTPLGTGVKCNTGEYILPPAIVVTATCPY
jgi:hypothetical protein